MSDPVQPGSIDPLSIPPVPLGATVTAQQNVVTPQQEPTVEPVLNVPPASPPALPETEPPAELTNPSTPLPPVTPTTSSDADAPSGFNWGAFWLTWVWGVGHSIWVSLLVIFIWMSIFFAGLIPTLFTAFFSAFSLSGKPLAIVGLIIYAVNLIVTLIIAFWFGKKGNLWAWDRRGSRTVAEFQARERSWSIAGWVIGLLFAISWVMSAANLVNSYFAPPITVNCANGVTVTIDGQNRCSAASSTIVSAGGNANTSASTTTETPLGSAAAVNGVAIKVTNAQRDPAVTGDSPDAGMQYLQIDLSMTNTGATSVMVSGDLFAYQTASGQILDTANTFSGTSSGSSQLNGQSLDVTGSSSATSSGKNVDISGRQQLVVVSVEPDNADTTHSLIFQIPKGDQGKLIARGGNTFDSSRPTLAIFKLQ